MKNKPTKIWVVYGQTGEYSDRSEWNIAAYLREEDAKAHADAATAWYQDNNVMANRHQERKESNPFDPSMRVDYTGTEWNIYPVDLFKSCERQTP